MDSSVGVPTEVGSGSFPVGFRCEIGLTAAGFQTSGWAFGFDDNEENGIVGPSLTGKSMIPLDGGDCPYDSMPTTSSCRAGSVVRDLER